MTLSSNAAANPFGAAGFSLSVDGDGAYTLTGGTPSRTYTAKASALDTSVTPNVLTFTGIDDVDGGKTATLKIPIGGSGFTAPTASPSTPTNIGAITTSATYDVTLTTVDKSGAAVSKTVNWDPAAPSDTLGLGDITMTIDPAKFKDALNKGINNVSAGNVGPGPGVPIKVAHLAVAKFANRDGLSQDGEGYYVETTNSGTAVATIPGGGGTGNLRAGALEMSNVDLSREFTEMIITQRGFQANTRMITVSDEMLSELVSMKR
jgi:flagellar hook protein FlgE